MTQKRVTTTKKQRNNAPYSTSKQHGILGGMGGFTVLNYTS
ncbi:hypothetical protein BTN49_0437 [Candidatus Enterovibrio escicola]|uniref:Uncharacterized protein n=1 Tax=Candidatus Enterovibrio escicola TaxID=1927127 RepID=A0A2A5T5J0_9GAMM|nr:hypothetical protein BTN49_0437 [Candidatus Enterovibrio escacola]